MGYFFAEQRTAMLLDKSVGSLSQAGEDTEPPRFKHYNDMLRRISHGRLHKLEMLALSLVWLKIITDLKIIRPSESGALSSET